MSEPNYCVHVRSNTYFKAKMSVELMYTKVKFFIYLD